VLTQHLHLAGAGLKQQACIKPGFSYILKASWKVGFSGSENIGVNLPRQFQKHNEQEINMF